MAEPEVKLRPSKEKLVMPTPRPINESIGSDYIPEPPPKKPLGKINPSLLADVEFRADIEPGMVNPLARLGYKLVEEGNVDFISYIAERGYDINVGGIFIPDKENLGVIKRQPFDLIGELEMQGIKIKKMPPGGIAAVVAGQDKTKKGDETRSATHELAHAAFQYLRDKDLLPRFVKPKYTKKEEDIVTALDYIKVKDDPYNFATDQEIFKDPNRIDPVLREMAFKDVTQKMVEPILSAAEKELRKKGVPPRAKRVTPPSPPPLRSEVFPKPPPSRSSQLNMIEKLFGRFLRKN